MSSERESILLTSPTHARPYAWLIAWACSIGGCAHGEPAPIASPPTAAARAPLAKRLAPPAAPKPSETFESFMAEHYVITAWARDAVIAGDIGELREPLRALADYRYDSVQMGAWSPWMAQLQQAADLTSRANSIELAAAGVATMGRICGDCHRAAGHGPVSEAPQSPTTDATQPFARRMQVHSWAADQLWRGLTTPSDAAWDAGANALARLPIDRIGKEIPNDYAPALMELRGLGTSAVGVTSSEQRADVYGVLLATCGDCHIDTIDHAF